VKKWGFFIGIKRAKNKQIPARDKTHISLQYYKTPMPTGWMLKNDAKSRFTLIFALSTQYQKQKKQVKNLLFK
jgi:hypothetical protein